MPLKFNYHVYLLIAFYIFFTRRFKALFAFRLVFTSKPGLIMLLLFLSLLTAPFNLFRSYYEIVFTLLTALLITYHCTTFIGLCLLCHLITSPLRILFNSYVFGVLDTQDIHISNVLICHIHCDSSNPWDETEIECT